MRCPLCNVPMREANRRGVLIDVCPECRGIWLDGGELDKLLTAGEAWESERRSDRDREGSHDYRPDDDDRRHPKKKRGFLGEIFDFD